MSSRMKDFAFDVLKIRSTLQESIQEDITASYPGFEGIIDSILPGEDALRMINCKDITAIANPYGELFFFRIPGKSWMPTLQTLRKCPALLITLQINEEASKSIFSEEDVMCPAEELAKIPLNTIVALKVEGKPDAIAIGEAVLSTESHQTVEITIYHHEDDILSKMQPLESLDYLSQTPTTSSANVDTGLSREYNRRLTNTDQVLEVEDFLNPVDLEVNLDTDGSGMTTPTERFRDIDIQDPLDDLMFPEKVDWNPTQRSKKLLEPNRKLNRNKQAQTLPLETHKEIDENLDLDLTNIPH